MLSEDEKSRIRLALGFPHAWRYLNVRLEGVLDGLNGQFTAEAEARIRDALAGIASVDAKIQTAVLSRAGVKRVDEIEFFESAVYRDLSNVGRMHVGRLSVACGVPVQADIFSGEGYPGDSYSDSGMSGRGRGMIPLG